MSFQYGNNITVQLFGQSHADAIGVVLDGLPAGKPVDLALIQQFMARRAPGQNALSTARREPDKPEILCGLLNGLTTGTPLTAIIRNSDTRSADYDAMARIPRPSHADWPAHVKFGGKNDVRGGGAFSGRMTAPLCFAGAVCSQLLAQHGIEVFAHISTLAGIADARPDFCVPDTVALRAVRNKEFPVLDDAVGVSMSEAILAARADGDSVGGSIECLITGMPVGLGRHMFDGVENRMAAAVFGIPGIKGIEFGSGFAGCEKRGSQNNDPFALRNNQIVTLSNAHGGVLGGMTSGMPIVFRVAVKPTPSIAMEQHSVDFDTMTPTELRIHGRHDPCIAVRAVPVVEAVAALVMLDLLFDAPGC